MKTITIPLELVEEILRVTDYMTDSSNIIVPEYYHKLKKLVEDKQYGTLENNEDGEIYRVWKFPLPKEEQKEHDRILSEFLNGLIPNGILYCENLTELSQKKGIRAFVKSTREIYVFKDGEWLLDPTSSPSQT